jgi:hypothetical protein
MVGYVQQFHVLHVYLSLDGMHSRARAKGFLQKVCMGINIMIRKKMCRIPTMAGQAYDLHGDKFLEGAQWGMVTYDDDEAEGAWPNGTCVVKSKQLDPREITPIGAKGIVMGSIAMPPGAITEQLERGLADVKYGYFVEWEDTKLVVFCIDKKLALKEPVDG